MNFSAQRAVVECHFICVAHYIRTLRECPGDSALVNWLQVPHKQWMRERKRKMIETRFEKILTQDSCSIFDMYAWRFVVVVVKKLSTFLYKAGSV